METNRAEFADTGGDKLEVSQVCRHTGFAVIFDVYCAQYPDGSYAISEELHFPLDTARQIAAHINKLVDEMEQAE